MGGKRVTHPAHTKNCRTAPTMLQCPECRQRRRESHTRYNRKVGHKPFVPGRTHGTISCYNMPCTDGPEGGRCEDCKRAAREKRAYHRRQARERAAV